MLHLPPKQCTLWHAVASSVVFLTRMFVHQGLHHVTASSRQGDACACCEEHDMHSKAHHCVQQHHVHFTGLQGYRKERPSVKTCDC
eukprot:888115-Pelagomonas_calceolata.AAC.1